MERGVIESDAGRLGRLAGLALRGVVTEYPVKPADVVAGRGDVRPARDVHPAFYGCFDWHSAVHAHWMLVRLLRVGAAPRLAGEIRAALRDHLTDERLGTEAAYFRSPRNGAFERMYGWAWVLRLAAELREWPDEDAAVWARHLASLEREIVRLTLAYLPRLSWPIRAGVHANSAFALAQALDYARVAEEGSLESLVVERARRYYLADRDAPIAYEPSGEDFLSPTLAEADLMRRVLPRDEFGRWLDAFLPSLAAGSLGPLGRPVEEIDMADGRLGHLAGLNLSRAWAMRGVAATLPADDPRRGVLGGAASDHLAAGLARVESGHYEGEHWLATFAVYAITGVGLPA
jgi:hypothetical protein